MSTSTIAGILGMVSYCIGCLISYWIGYRLGLRDGGRREEG